MEYLQDQFNRLDIKGGAVSALPQAAASEQLGVFRPQQPECEIYGTADVMMLFVRKSIFEYRPACMQVISMTGQVPAHMSAFGLDDVRCRRGFDLRCSYWMMENVDP